MAVGQRRCRKSWSPVCWRQLKMCASLPKTPMAKGDLAWWWNAAVASAAKEKQRCRKTRPSTLPNMLFIWELPRLNKSSRTLHLAALTFSASPTKWDVKTWMSKNPIRNVYGELCLDDRPKQAAWKEYCERLSNVKFDWDPSSLTELYPVLIPAPTSHLSWWSRPSSWLNVARLLLHSWP